MKKKSANLKPCTSCARIELRLNTLIMWIAQSANGTLSPQDAARLLNEIGVE